MGDLGEFEWTKRMLAKKNLSHSDMEEFIDKGMLIVKSKLICDAIIGVTNFSL